MAKVVIDAGHGINTAGKRCSKSLDPKQTREWTLNSRIAKYVVDHLKRHGISVLRVDDTTGKKDISLSQRCKKANEFNADLYVSIHHNSGVKGGSGGGTSCFMYNKTTKELSKTLRDNVYDCSVKETGLKGNRAEPKTKANFKVLRDTKMPACLIECGFMDSKTDIQYILTNSFAKKCALGISKGIIKTLKMKWVDEAQKTETTNTTNTGGTGKVTVTLNVLKKGSKGKQVGTVQRILKELGFYTHKAGVDNSFGDGTDEAVRKFQKARGLKVDGSVGPDTWKELLGA